jgi:hypothetical protein
MRFVHSLTAAVFVLGLSGTASAQGWEEFTDRAEFFTINLPGDPKVESITYKTEKGTSLPAKVYTAMDSRGEYKVTVVNYESAPAEIETAIAEAAEAIRVQGEVKYDGVEHQNNMRSQRLTVMLPESKNLLLGEALKNQNRLYILEATTAPNAPPPAQFQASLQVLDDKGVAIRYRNPNSTERVR